MRFHLIGLTTLLLSGLTSCASAGDQPGFAVVELFTSEGCSSCPPADAVLSKKVTDARKTGQAIYPLEFHVDYWNRLGWIDHFSSAKFSVRQQAYAVAMGKDQTYTPQMIVNGSVEFTGSDSARADQEIKSALEDHHHAEIKIDVHINNGKVAINYDAKSVPTDSVLNFALVERGLSTSVKGGENDGKVLQHENVVRALTTIEKSSHGRIEIPLSDQMNANNCSVVAFVQDSKSMGISAAVAADLTLVKGR